MSNKRLLICDLDNTLYDWVNYYVLSFYAMVDSVVSITGCDKEKLLDDFRTVHQAHGDSEKPFALLETDTIKKFYPGVPANVLLKELDLAFHAFNSSRKKNLTLYPNVRETLNILVKNNIKLIAHTESKLYGVVDRLVRLELVPYFSKIYCRERSLSEHPEGNTGWLERFPMDKVTELSNHQAKPNPSILLEICAKEEIPYENTAYVGDSIARDILMAKRSGVFAIWAAYGSVYDKTTYDALVRVSHWTKEEVEREIRLKEEAKTIKPDYVAHNSFAEVLEAIGI